VPIRVFLLDDHALVRTGLRMILAADLSIEIVGEAENAESALPQIRELKPHILLCELNLPGLSGLEVTERIRRGRYGTRVIVVSMLEDGPMLRRVLEIGALGYVGKGGNASELVYAVHQVARGKRYLSHLVAHNLALSSIKGEISPFDRLSGREIEIALMLLQGLRQEEIARCLHLSAKTVNTHKSRLFLKIGVHDIVALARVATQYRMLEPSRCLNYF